MEPEPIETERLILRPVSPADLEDLIALHSDELVQRVFGETTRAEVIEWIAANERQWSERGHGRVAVVDRESGRFLGRSGLRHWPQFDEVEVGWTLRADARGRGIATEAGRACVDWGLGDLGLSYVTAMILPDNTASIAVAGRLGMSPLRPDTLHGEDVVVYSTPVPG